MSRPLTPLLLLALGALAIPPLTVEVAPLCDHVNHLVRMWLIAEGTREAPVSEMYEVSWGLARTNVGMDYLAAALGGLVPATTIGALSVLLAVVLPPLGAVLVNRALLGGFHWWQIGFALIAWNTTLIAGFINFQIGVGLALLAAALEPRIAGRSWPAALAMRAMLGWLVMTVHLFGLVFYVALVGVIAFGDRFAGLASVGGWWRRIGPAALGALGAALALVPLVLLAPALPGAHVGYVDNLPYWDFSFHNKLRVLISPVSTYALPLDLLGLAVVAAPALWALLQGRLAVHAGLVLLAGAMTLAGLLAPSALAGTWWIDSRPPLMGALALLAGLRPNLDLAPRRALHVALALLAVVSLRTAWVGTAWHARQADIASIRRAVATVEPGKALLPLDHGGPGIEPTRYPFGRYYNLGQPVHWYFPLLAVMWRKAFVPSLYAAVGKQPVRVKPPWDEISHSEVGLSASVDLIEPQFDSGYFKEWRTRYDYILLLNADVGRGIDLAMLPELRLVTDEGFARLYRVVR